MARSDGRRTSVSVPHLLLDGAGRGNGNNAQDALADDRAASGTLSGSGQDRGRLTADREVGGAARQVEITPELIECVAEIIQTLEVGKHSSRQVARSIFDYLARCRNFPEHPS